EEEHGVDVPQLHLGRRLHPVRGVVQDGADVRVHQRVHHVLRHLTRYGHDADVHGRTSEVALQLGDVADLAALDLGAHQIGAGVVQGDDVEPLALEARVGGDGASPPAHADDRDAPA